MLNNQKGLTLIEVLAGTVILSIVILLFLNISGYSVLSNRKDDLRINGLRLAETVLNEQRSALTATIPLLSWTYSGTAFQAPYTITVQHTGLTPTATTYNRSSFKDNLVSLQCIILFKDTLTLVPRLLTVTVSWEG